MPRDSRTVAGMDQNPMRLALMAIADMFEPMHELVLGEVAHFQRQGFTIEQAHAMAAAEFVNAFGQRIEHGATMPGDDERPHPEG